MKDSAGGSFKRRMEKLLKEQEGNESGDRLSWEDVDFILKHNLVLRHVSNEEQAARERVEGAKSGDALNLTFDLAENERDVQVAARFKVEKRIRNNQTLDWYESAIKRFIGNALHAFAEGDANTFFLLKLPQMSPGGGYDEHTFDGLTKLGRKELRPDHYVAEFRVQNTNGSEPQKKVDEAFALFLGKTRELRRAQ